MKFNPVLTLLIFVIVFSGCSKKKTAWEYDGLKGKVKTMRVTTYRLNAVTNNISNNQKKYDFLIKYNSNGNWIEYRSFNIDESTKWLEKPVYNEQGQVISRSDYSYENSDSILIRKFKYKNDNQGNIIETICKDKEDSLLWKQKFNYDNRGNIIEIQKLTAYDSLEWKKTSQYNKANRIIEEIKSNSDSLISKSIYIYDSRGNNIEKRNYDKNDSIKIRIIYNYNKQRDYEEVKVYSIDNKLTERTAYKYKYDIKGNWTEKVKLVNDVPKTITKRQITYY